jgi:hypothetical protein
VRGTKISIRFFDDREVRAVWEEENAKWYFSVLDIVAVLIDQNDYTKNRNYWKYLKAKLKKENSQVVSATTQLKFLAPDGKMRLADMLYYKGISSGMYGLGANCACKLGCLSDVSAELVKCSLLGYPLRNLGLHSYNTANWLD